MINPLSVLTGKRFRIGRNDCYTLANEARILLGRPKLPRYSNYMASSYSDLIQQGLTKMQPVAVPVNGCLVVIMSADLALGIYYNGNVLCFNSRQCSDIVSLAIVPVYGFFD